MGVITSAGAKLYIGTTAANGATDSYTEVGEIVNIGEFGRVYSEVTFTALGNRNVRKFKGARNDGNIALQLGRDLDDAGQDAVRVALDSDEDFNFKVTLNDADPDDEDAEPTTIIFKAKVMSHTTNIGGSEQVVGANTTLGIKSGSITETAHNP